MKKLTLILTLLLFNQNLLFADIGFDFDFLNPFTNKKVFIIGASTVRYDYDDKRVGWGTALCKYNMKKSKNGFNEARRGATAESYKEMNSTIKKTKGRAYWSRTKSLIDKNSGFLGGFLLIQFGGNDNIRKVSKETFIRELKVYIDEARDFGLTPVLITPVNSRLMIDGALYDNRGSFPSYLRELAEQEDVILLDLHKKSIDEFTKLTKEELAEKFGAIRYKDGSVDVTHFNLNGAKIVANWIQELACDKDISLCKQFKNENPL